MYLHPYVASQLASERHREELARAAQQRRAWQFMALARASRRAERAERRIRQAFCRALRLPAGLEQ